MSTNSDVRPSFLPEGYNAQFLIGSGQSANVFLALYHHDKEFALKMLKPLAKGDPVLRRMFEREVELTMSFDHKNVVKAHEGQGTGDKAYMVLEYYPEDLGDFLAHKTKDNFALKDAYKLILGIASGVAHVHAKNIIHRDLKPANVYLTEDAIPKIADFGTGTYIGEPQEERAGTVYYMAPEIFMGEPASVQSDIYSLGVMAYEILAGRRPFIGQEYEDVKNAHLFNTAKNVSYFRKDVDRRVSKVVNKALAKETSNRYRTVTEFGKAFKVAIRPEKTLSETDEAQVKRNESVSSQGKSKKQKEEKKQGLLGRLFGRKS